MDSTGSPQAVPAQEDLTAYAPASPTLDKTPIPTITEDDDDESEASSDCSSVQNGISIQMTPTKALPTIEEAFNSLSCRAICTFGFGSSCFYYAGDRCNSWKYLADKKNPLLGITATAVKRMNMSTPHCVALSTLGAGYFAYTSPSAGVCWRFFSMPQEMRPKTLGGRKGRKRFDDVQMAHKQLKKWLQENIVTENDIRTAKVVFGAGASFMAWKMDSNEWISNELPSSLTSELEQRRMHSKGAKEMPKLVTLGAGKSWAAVWSDGTHSIDLDNKYPTLSHSLKGIVSYKILYIALCPTRVGSHYYTRLYPLRQLALIASERLIQIVLNDWESQMLALSRETASKICLTSTQGGESSRRIISPHVEAQAAIIQSTMKAEESSRLAEEAAQLSIESSKESIAASKISVIGSTLAIAAVCTLM